MIKIQFKNKDYTIKQSFRSLMMFEKMTEKTIDQIDDSINDIITLFYCLLSANNKESFTYTFDQFLDELDENPDSLEKFKVYLEDLAKQNQEKNTDTDKKKQD